MAMIDLSFVKLFSAPTSEFVISAIIVCGFGYIFFRIGSDKQGAAATAWWKLLSLMAEVCVAVGLIGLATFAGRAKISADHQYMGERIRLAQSALGEDFRMAMLTNCEPGGRGALSPFSPAVAKKELCAISRSYIAVYAPDADWELAERSLREFTGKYPGCIENVFTRNSDCEHTVKSATRIAEDIRAMQRNKGLFSADESMSAIIQKPDSSWFLLLAFFIAAIGVSIKCARAASEFFSLEKTSGT